MTDTTILRSHWSPRRLDLPVKEILESRNQRGLLQLLAGHLPAGAALSPGLPFPSLSEGCPGSGTDQPTAQPGLTLRGAEEEKLYFRSRERNRLTKPLAVRGQAGGCWACGFTRNTRKMVPTVQAEGDGGMAGQQHARKRHQGSPWLSVHCEPVT